jgi:hypothetical protein
MEKRKGLRRPVGQPVAILRSDGSFVCECTLRDVSDGGARIALTVKPGTAVPDIAPEFILSLTRRGNLIRYCETIWRRENEIGVRFIARKGA